jgi:pimeloyl-[acyl-carrier protein] methyl ester esterase
MLVLQPGMDGTGALFDPFSRYVQSTCSARVVGYPRDAELTHPALEQHVLDNLPSSESVTLIGESFSSPIALHLSNNPKLNIRAAVLVCSFAFILWERWVPCPHACRSEFFCDWRRAEMILRTFLPGRAPSDELVATTVAAISAVRPRGSGQAASARLLD